MSLDTCLCRTPLCYALAVTIVPKELEFLEFMRTARSPVNASGEARLLTRKEAALHCSQRIVQDSFTVKYVGKFANG